MLSSFWDAVSFSGSVSDWSWQTWAFIIGIWCLLSRW